MIRFLQYAGLPRNVRGNHALIGAAFSGAEGLVCAQLQRARPSQQAWEFAVWAAMAGGRDRVLERLLGCSGYAISDEYCRSFAAMMVQGEAGVPAFTAEKERCVRLLLNSPSEPAERARIALALGTNVPDTKFKALLMPYLVEEMLRRQAQPARLP